MIYTNGINGEATEGLQEKALPKVRQVCVTSGIYQKILCFEIDNANVRLVNIFKTIEE